MTVNTPPQTVVARPEGDWLPTPYFSALLNTGIKKEIIKLKMKDKLKWHIGVRERIGEDGSGYGGSTIEGLDVFDFGSQAR